MTATPHRPFLRKLQKPRLRAFLRRVRTCESWLATHFNADPICWVGSTHITYRTPLDAIHAPARQLYNPANVARSIPLARPGFRSRFLPQWVQIAGER